MPLFIPVHPAPSDPTKRTPLKQTNKHKYRNVSVTSVSHIQYSPSPTYPKINPPTDGSTIRNT